MAEAITLGKLIEQYGPELAKGVVIAWFAMFKFWPWLTVTVDKWMQLQHDTAKMEHDQSERWVLVIEQLRAAIDKFSEVSKVQHEEVLRRFDHIEGIKAADGRN